MSLDQYSHFLMFRSIKICPNPYNYLHLVSAPFGLLKKFPQSDVCIDVTLIISVS